MAGIHNKKSLEKKLSQIQEYTTQKQLEEMEQRLQSMDDFGSGYSSLNTLKDITFDEVKIDKRFLGDSLTENGRIVLQEIFHLLKRTRKTIVCEGVETREVADFLIQEGCDELQGYYYYRPMKQENFEMLMKEQNRKEINRNIAS